MTEQRTITPLKVGLLAVVTAYFLFTFHGMFTLSWIGEWDRIGGGSFGFVLLVEDISATIGLIFRFVASILAIAAVAYYLTKGMSNAKAFKVLRWIMVFEGVYWFGLIATAGFDILFFGQLVLGNAPILAVLQNLSLTVIPNILEAIVLPIALFILALKLHPNKTLKGAIKWSLISATVMVAVFWLINTGIWVGVVFGSGFGGPVKGPEYLFAHPEHLVSFITTAVGLAALTVYMAYFTKKSSQTETLQGLKRGPIGAIILALGLFFFWNYFSWAAFAGNTWNDWYAWFLGHNMDLFLLSLPLVGLPLLFSAKKRQTAPAPE